MVEKEDWSKTRIQDVKKSLIQMTTSLRNAIANQ